MIFAYFLGMCSYLAVSKTVKTSFGLGIAVIFVLFITVPVNYLLDNYVLKPGALQWLLGDEAAGIDLSFLSFIMFIAIIAAMVQLVEMIVEKFAPALYNQLGIFLPLITTNCAVLGVAILSINNNYTYIQSIVNAFGAGVGYFVAMVLFAGVREEKLWDESGVPAAFKGMPMILISATILSLSFMGFTGLFQ